MYKLKILGPPYNQFSLTTGAYRLGSASDSEMVIEDPSVAAHHCEILVTSIFTVRDLSPNHETYIDDERIEKAQLLPGQTLRLGNVKLALEEVDAVVAGATSTSGRTGSSTPLAKKSRGRFFEKVGLPLLLLISFAGMIALLYSNRSPQENKANAPSAAKTAAAKATTPSTRKKEDQPSETPATKASRRTSNQDDKKPNANPPPSRNAEATDPKLADAGSGANSGANPSSPKQTLAPSEVNQFPDPNAGRTPRSPNIPRPALPLEQTLQEQQKALGPEAPEVTKTLEKLGRHYRDTGEFEKAEPYLQKALNNTRKARGPEHPEMATALNNLGELHTASGDYAKAGPLLDRALAIREKALPPNHPDIGVSLNNSAALKAAQGDFAAAAPLMDRALKNFASALNINDPAIPAALNRLAGLHDAAGNSAEAERLFQAAEKIAEKALGPEHPETAKSRSKLADHHRKQGDPAKAAPLYQKAAADLEKSLGPGHPETEAALDNLSRLNLCQGDPKEVRELAARALRAKRELLMALLSCASEQQLLAYRERLTPYSLSVFSQSAPELALVVLQFKGVVLDAMIEQQLAAKASRDPDSFSLADNFRDAKEKLAQLLFGTPNDFSPGAVERRQVDKLALTEKLQQSEETLARRVPGVGRAHHVMDLTLEQVQKAIPDRAALVEFVRYSRCRDSEHWEPCYGAVVLSASGQPKWIPLGNAEAIDKNIERYQIESQKGVDAASQETTKPSDRNAAGPAAQANGAEPAKTEIAAPAASEKSFADLLQSMSKQLWEPISSALPAGVQTVIISPDAALNVVSFAALLTPGNDFLCEKYSVRYVSTGRDLLQEKPTLRGGPAAIFAAPDFSQRPSASSLVAGGNFASNRDPDKRDFRSVQLPRLSASAEEAALLEHLLRRKNLALTSFFGTKASEADLAQMGSPNVLHLATCGFFLPTNIQESDADVRTVLSDPFEGLGFLETSANGKVVPRAGSALAKRSFLSNPLHRSGLALTGAQATFKAWEQGENPLSNDDGVVTADEIGTFKLAGTDLVLLSSSEISAGSIRAGEMVLALRRALIQAGAQNFLMMLGTGADKDTARVLMSFYESFFATGDAPRSLAEAQRDWIVRLRKERGLHAAVRLAGSFVMNSVGPVQ